MAHTNSVRFARVLVMTLLFLTAGSSFGGATESEADVVGTPDDFGVSNTNFLFISAEQFQASASPDCHYSDAGDNFWGCVGTDGADLYAPIQLPSGALVTGVRVIYYDNNGLDDLRVRIQRCWKEIFVNYQGTETLLDWSSSGTPGHAFDYVDVPDFTIRYHTSIPTVSSVYQSYLLRLRIYQNLMLFRGVVVFWKRQVSPAPGVATFADVPPSHPFFQFVEALAASGITGGCGGGNYCPDDPLTRGQMAVFLSAALGLHW